MMWGSMAAGGSACMWRRGDALLALSVAACALGACSKGDLSDASRAVEESEPSPVADQSAPDGMVLVGGGTFQMGSDDGFPHERPVHEVRLDSFYLDAREVTNAQFEAFVEATGYATEAERWGWSLVFNTTAEADERVLGQEWWMKAADVNWRNPEGPGSSIDGKEDYPVIQVSWNDAKAYSRWADKRLPTEAEWEYAARGGKSQVQYPWGDSFQMKGRSMGNTWEGVFPAADSGEDGYSSLAPVGQYPPNEFGLYDMGGNVWEWCEDWYDRSYYFGGPVVNPQGPSSGAEKILRGGSWLCSPNYCHGYRVAHRNKSASDSGLSNVGFRCAQSLTTAL